MSRERELLRKILDKTNYINYACNDKIRNEIMESLFQPEPTITQTEAYKRGYSAGVKDLKAKIDNIFARLGVE